MFISRAIYDMYCDSYQTNHGALPYNTEFKKTYIEGSEGLCELVPVVGKANSQYIHITPKTNMLVGVDQMGDVERVNVNKYSPDTLTYEMRMFFGVDFETVDSRMFKARMRWEDDFRAYLKGLAEKKGVIVCGDLNVAHKEIDLKNPKGNRQNPGFTDEERGQFTNLLDAGFTDTFRYFYPDQTDIYSWWSYRFQARQKNVGWRIDYFVASDDLRPRLKDAKIHTEIFGSDHCPVELTIE